MRKHVGLSSATDDQHEQRRELSTARTWALIFLAEHVAADRADQLRERIRAQEREVAD